jgi:hypothetical protein
MKSYLTYVGILTLTISTLSCTMGDKGEEGRTDSTSMTVDTSASTQSATSGSNGVGVNPAPSVNTGKGTIMEDTTATADSTSAKKQP